MQSFKLLLLSSTLLIAAPHVAHAQAPAGDNVVKQAADAFGLRVGSESIGLYDSDNVRGFSPSSAGNIRLEGLFIRTMGGLSDRVVDATSIRVGLNTVGQLFPAPSGIADLRLRDPDATGGDVSVGIDPYLSPFAELDVGLVSGDSTWKLAAGAGIRPDENGGTGGDSQGWNAGLVPRWQPTDRLTIIGYLDWAQTHDIEVVPGYFPADATLPPRINRRVDHTQSWGDYAYETENQGIIVNADLASGLTGRVGLFRSVETLPEDAFALLEGVTPDRMGKMLYVLLPETRYAATSGEMSLRYEWVGGHTAHAVTLVGRGLSTRSRKGGEVEISLGPWSLDTPVDIPRPALTFDRPQDRNHVEQLTGGVSYHLQWDGRLDIGAGLQKADYAKTTRPGAGLRARGTSAPWLYNAIAAWKFTDTVVGYASYSKGLEESGSAPIYAVNPNAVLPAVETTQRELGLRTSLGPLTLTSSAFDVRRPYDGVDGDGFYGFLGKVRHRGVEASLSGEPLPGLSLVLGALLLDPTVSGPEVDEGLIGRRPVGQTRLQWQASVDYAPEFLGGASLDLTIDHSNKTIARGDNRADAPGFTLVDLGGRHSLTLFGREMTLRGQVQNLFNKFAWEVEGDGEYSPVSRRSWRLSLSGQF